MTFGKPWDCSMLRNSNVSLNKFQQLYAKFASMIEAHHFEPKRPIHQQQNQIGDLPYVNHGVEVVVALQKCEPPSLSADNGDGSPDVVQGLLCESSNEALEKRCFPHSRWSNYSNDDGRRILVWCTVDKGYVEARLVSFYSPSGLPVRPASGSRGECLRTRSIHWSTCHENCDDSRTFSLKPVEDFSFSFLSTLPLDWLCRCGLCPCCSIYHQSGRVIEKRRKGYT